MDEVSRNELKPILNDMKAVNLDGYNKCKSAIIFQQIVSGSYMRKDDIVNVRDLMGPWFSNPLCVAAIDSIVPEWMHLPVVPLSMIIDNARHNARGHGKQNAKYQVEVSTNKGRLLIEIKNEAGANHEQALQMQQEQGTNFLFLDANADLEAIRSHHSTFLGIGEMRDAAVIAAELRRRIDWVGLHRMRFRVGIGLVFVKSGLLLHI